MTWYSAGTVNVTSGSDTVTGAGTSFADYVDAGQGFVGPDGRTYEITSVVSAASMKIAPNYAGATASAQPYRILPAQGYLRQLAQEVSELLDTFLVVRDGIGQGIFPAGTAGTPGFRFAGDEDTGITQVGPNTFAISTNGVVRLVVSNDGVTFTDLTIEDLIADKISADSLLLDDGTLANPAAAFRSDPNTGWRRPGEGQLAVVSNGADNVLFDADGTTRFYGAARFADGTAAAPGMRFHLDPNTGIWRPADDTIAIVTAGVERLRVFDTGEVSIGSAEKSVRFSVTGPVTTTFAPNIYNTALTGASSATSGSAGSGISFRGYTTGSTTISDLAFISGIKENATSGNYAGALVLGTRPNGSGGGSFERMRINSAGNVIIGQTGATPEKLTVAEGLIYCVTSGRAGLRLYNGGGQSEWFLGQTVSSDSQFKIQTLVAGNYTDRLVCDTSGNVFSGTDNSNNACGLPNRRWSVVFSATGAINTSDERDKVIEENGGIIPDEWLDAWGDVQWCRFKFKDAFEEKGDEARWHVGLIAQHVRNTFTAHGIDGTQIGLLCYDEWEEEREPIMVEAQIDTETVVVKRIKTGIIDPNTGEMRYREVTKDAPVMGMVDSGETRITLPAGNRWGLRYDLCQAMEAAWQRREIARNEARIASLEAIIASMKPSEG